MKNFFILPMIAAALIITGCSSSSKDLVSSVPSLIKEGFKSDTEYEIICRGYPKEGLQGVMKVESGKRAALLNAYYFAERKFDDSVIPDKDGKAEKFVLNQDHAIVYYTIKKSNLRKRVRK